MQHPIVLANLPIRACFAVSNLVKFKRTFKGTNYAIEPIQSFATFDILLPNRHVCHFGLFNIVINWFKIVLCYIFFLIQYKNRITKFRFIKNLSSTARVLQTDSIGSQFIFCLFLVRMGFTATKDFRNQQGYWLCPCAHVILHVLPREETKCRPHQPKYRKSTNKITAKLATMPLVSKLRSF